MGKMTLGRGDDGRGTRVRVVGPSRPDPRHERCHVTIRAHSTTRKPWRGTVPAPSRQILRGASYSALPTPSPRPLTPPTVCLTRPGAPRLRLCRFWEFGFSEIRNHGPALSPRSSRKARDASIMISPMHVQSHWPGGPYEESGSLTYFDLP